jgi:hypothetical protein
MRDVRPVCIDSLMVLADRSLQAIHRAAVSLHRQSMFLPGPLGILGVTTRRLSGSGAIVLQPA